MGSLNKVTEANFTHLLTIATTVAAKTVEAKKETITVAAKKEKIQDIFIRSFEDEKSCVVIKTETSWFSRTWEVITSIFLRKKITPYNLKDNLKYLSKMITNSSIPEKTTEKEIETIKKFVETLKLIVDSVPKRLELEAPMNEVSMKAEALLTKSESAPTPVAAKVDKKKEEEFVKQLLKNKTIPSAELQKAIDQVQESESKERLVFRQLTDAASHAGRGNIEMIERTLTALKAFSTQNKERKSLIERFMEQLQKRARLLQRAHPLQEGRRL